MQRRFLHSSSFIIHSSLIEWCLWSLSNRIANSRTQGFECRIRDFPIYRHEVFFLVFKRWVEQSVGDTSVIGEENQSRRVFVESSDGKHSERNVDNIDNTFPVFLSTGCLYSTGFIDSIVDTFFISLDELSTILDGILFWINRLTDLGDDAIDGDVSCSNRLLGMTTRADTAFGHIFL